MRRREATCGPWGSSSGRHSRERTRSGACRSRRSPRRSPRARHRSRRVARDLPRRLLANVDTALAVDPTRRPPAGRLALELRESFVVAHRPERRVGPERHPGARTKATARRCRRHPDRARASASPRRASPVSPQPAARRCSLSGHRGSSRSSPSPPPCLTLRAPRAGLALTLFAPVFPLGNVAAGAAVAYGVLAALWLAVSWGDARTGLSFVAGPLLAPLGLLALVPLAVQPVQRAWRRGLQAFAAVLAAALAAGLTHGPLPLTQITVGDLGVEGNGTPLRRRERRHRRCCTTRAHS